MISRRGFLGASVYGFGGGRGRRRRLAGRSAKEAGHRHHGVARKRSHAWHMGDRFLVGYPVEGKWHHPPLEVVSAYVDQVPKNDLSRKRAEEFGFKIYPTIAGPCAAAATSSPWMQC